MSVLDFLGDGGAAAEADATDPHWAKTPQNNYNRLIFADPEKLGLAGTSGIYVIWHAGIRPEWVYVAKSNDLATDLDSIQDNEAVMYYDSQGGLFVTWAFVRDEYQDGVLKFLIDKMQPIIDNPAPPKKKVKPLPVLLPTDRSDKDGQEKSGG